MRINIITMMLVVCILLSGCQEKKTEHTSNINENLTVANESVEVNVEIDNTINTEMEEYIKDNISGEQSGKDTNETGFIPESIYEDTESTVDEYYENWIPGENETPLA